MLDDNEIRDAMTMLDSAAQSDFYFVVV